LVRPLGYVSVVIVAPDEFTRMLNAKQPNLYNQPSLTAASTQHHLLKKRLGAFIHQTSSSAEKIKAEQMHRGEGGTFAADYAKDVISASGFSFSNEILESDVDYFDPLDPPDTLGLTGMTADMLRLDAKYQQELRQHNFGEVVLKIHQSRLQPHSGFGAEEESWRLDLSLNDSLYETRADITTFLRTDKQLALDTSLMDQDWKPDARLIEPPKSQLASDFIVRYPDNVMAMPSQMLLLKPEAVNIVTSTDDIPYIRDIVSESW